MAAIDSPTTEIASTTLPTTLHLSRNLVFSSAAVTSFGSPFRVCSETILATPAAPPETPGKRSASEALTVSTKPDRSLPLLMSLAPSFLSHSPIRLRIASARLSSSFISALMVSVSFFVNTASTGFGRPAGSSQSNCVTTLPPPDSSKFFHLP